ncbi:BCCT family transporter [Microbulbifer sp. CNSA002]|uniref:BCCT family transporter n=1 Tax=unclassified Microbulbifer TaxID=2619833 RepID=UPI0039B3C2A0
MQESDAKKYIMDKKLTLVSFFLVLLLGVVAVIYPEGTKDFMKEMLALTIIDLGTIFLWYTLLGTLALLFLAFSKYGKLRLGEGKAKYSLVQLFSMALCAGMGASTMYWAYIEVIHYYMDPQFGISAESIKMEYATAFNIFHWGSAGWVINLMVAIPFSVSFHIKKNRTLKLSSVLNNMLGDRMPEWLKKGVDLLFIVTTLSATTLTLGLAIPMISYNVSALTGIPDSLSTGIAIIIGLSLLFSLSSFIGIEKGMSRISEWTIYIAIFLLLYTFIVGPSALIANNVTNSLGILFSEYFRMSLSTDPYGSTHFPQYWTIFFWATWISYSPGVGVFVTKISQGHRLRDVILTLILGGGLSSAFIFGIAGTYAVDLMNQGAVNAVQELSNGEPLRLAHDILNQLPLPELAIAIFLLSMILFCVTTLDATSYSLTGVVTKNLDAEANVMPAYRVFWCGLLTVIPIVFLFINADMDTLKSFPVLIVIPLLPILVILCVKTGAYLLSQFGDMSEGEIEAYRTPAKI